MSLYFDKGANRSLSNLDAAGEEKFTDKQDTLVSGENIKTINGVSVLGEGNIEVGEGGTITVNQTYDPTSSYAQSGTAVKEAMDYMNGTISNCILEIPQNIKCEIDSNNQIIVKAGTVLVYTSGNTYTTHTVANDIINTGSSVNGGTWTNFVYLIGRATTTQLWSDKVCFSVSTYSDLSNYTTEPYYLIYVVADKKFYFTADNGTTWNAIVNNSYPLAILKKDANDKWEFVKDSKGRDMIFNGAGFIGHHAFVYPNLKGLGADGEDTKGRLNSYNVGNNSLTISDMENTNSIFLYRNRAIGTRIYEGEFDTIAEAPTIEGGGTHLAYIKNINYMCYWGSSKWNILTGNDAQLLFIKYAYNGSAVTQFDIRQPYEGARDLLTDDKQDDVTTLTGYDATKTQTLKNVNGTLTWVDD